MLKRNLSILLLAGLLFGGAAYAWAQTGDTSTSTPTTAAAPGPANGNGPSDQASRRAVLEDCMHQAGVTDPKSATPAQSQQIRQCVAAHGVKGRPGPGPKALLGRVVHGDLIVRGTDGQFQNVTYDRGKEDGLQGNTLTITRPDNKKVSVTLTNDTKYRGVDNASQLQAGRQTLVLSKDGKALVVGQRGDKAQPQPGGAAQPSVFDEA